MNQTQAIYSQIRFLTRLIVTHEDNKYLFAAVHFVGEVDRRHFVDGVADQFGIFYPNPLAELTPAPVSKSTLGESAYRVLLYRVAAMHSCADLQPIVDVINLIEGARHNGIPLAALIKLVGIRLAQRAADDQVEDSAGVYILEEINLAQCSEGFRAMFVVRQPGSEAIKVIYDPGLAYGMESALIRAAVELHRIGPESTATTHNVSTDGRPGTYLVYPIPRRRGYSDERKEAVEIEVAANIPLINGAADSPQTAKLEES